VTGVKVRRFSPLFLAWGFLAVFVPQVAAQQQLGRIVGQIRVSKGDFPTHPILVEIQVRGSTFNSAYADDQGRFGFYNLEANPYHIVIHDPAFREVDEMINVNPIVSSFNMVQIQLDPREDAKRPSASDRKAGSNPYLIDTSEYGRYPKDALKEFDRALQADREGKRDEAIKHYQKALQIAPEFYKAHNNLGSDYLSKSNLAGARKEFELASRLNQSDAAAYFNLSNVSILLGDLVEARRYLEEGKHREPDSALGCFLEGTLNQRAGHLPQAELLLRQAIQLSPVMPQARLQLVNVLLQQDKKEDAVAQLQDFVGAFPDGPYSDQAKGLLKKLQASIPLEPLKH
jgi:tetratricopeptide (TPR) repeat protein